VPATVCNRYPSAPAASTDWTLAGWSTTVRTRIELPGKSPRSPWMTSPCCASGRSMSVTMTSGGDFEPCRVPQTRRLGDHDKIGLPFDQGAQPRPNDGAVVDQHHVDRRADGNFVLAARHGRPFGPNHVRHINTHQVYLRSNGDVVRRTVALVPHLVHLQWGPALSG